MLRTKCSKSTTVFNQLFSPTEPNLADTPLCFFHKLLHLYRFISILTKVGIQNTKEALGRRRTAVISKYVEQRLFPLKTSPLNFLSQMC